MNQYRNTYEGEIPEATCKCDVWQKCPVCDGQGRISNETKERLIIKNCTTCNGKRIISTVTGKPPEDE